MIDIIICNWTDTENTSHLSTPWFAQLLTQGQGVLSMQTTVDALLLNVMCTVQTTRLLVYTVLHGWIQCLYIQLTWAILSNIRIEDLFDMPIQNHHLYVIIFKALPISMQQKEVLCFYFELLVHICKLWDMLP